MLHLLLLHLLLHLLRLLHLLLRLLHLLHLLLLRLLHLLLLLRLLHLLLRLLRLLHLLLLLLLRLLLLLEAVQLLVVVLAHVRGLLSGLGALQAGERLVGAWLVLVRLAEWVRRKPLVQRQFAGVQRDALWEQRYYSVEFFVQVCIVQKNVP